MQANKSLIQINTIVLTMASFGFTNNVYAQGEQLQTVHVPGDDLPIEETTQKDFESVSGKSHIDRQELDTIPAGNGDLNEALRILPDVELNDPARTSNQAGEIKPGDIIILDGKSYQNNFMIDGISNNSILDPLSKNGFSNTEGHPQEIFLNTDIIRSIDVYSTNVPAEYGQFSGGVIDAKTKRADFFFSGKLSARYTSDKFTQFHVDDEYDLVDPENLKTTSRIQPKFEKQNYDLLVNTPITDNTAFYINLGRKQSTIPVIHLGETLYETRTNVNGMVKLSHFFSDDHILDVSYMQSPYESLVRLRDVAYSEQTVQGGGEKFTAELENHFSFGKLESRFSYGHSVNSRTGPDDFYAWATTTNKPWGIHNGHSFEGGYGDLDSEQTTYVIKSDLTIKQGKVTPNNHLIKIGIDVQRINAIKDRKTDANTYKIYDFKSSYGITNLQCQGAEACIDGDQFAAYKETRYASKRQANLDNVSAYIQDSINWSRFFFRLGLRYDYNDFLQNHDLAPRTFSKFDLTGNKNHFITTGFNRYYSNSFVSYKLRQAGASYSTGYRSSSNHIIDGQKVIIPDDWSVSAGRNANITDYNRLKTPYKDEFTFGIQSDILTGNLGIEYVYREGHDAITNRKLPKQDDGYTYNIQTNGGKSRYQSIRLDWNKNIKKHSFRFSLNKVLHNSSNYVAYDVTEFDDTDTSSTYIMYQGQIIEKSSVNIDEGDPISGKIYYGYNPFDGFNIGIFGTYTSTQKKFESTGDTYYGEETYNPKNDTYSFEKYELYELVEQDEQFRFDLQIGYRLKTDIGRFEFTLDANNLFDQVTPLKNNRDEYMLGRQLWFGMAYSWG